MDLFICDGYITYPEYDIIQLIYLLWKVKLYKRQTVL